MLHKIAGKGANLRIEFDKIAQIFDKKVPVTFHEKRKFIKSFASIRA